MPGRFEFERAIRRSDLPPLARLLALTLATWADMKTGEIPDRYQPAQSVLMQATGMSKSAFLSHRRTLVRDGWVSYDSPDPVKAREEHAQCSYRLHIPARSGDDLAKGDIADTGSGGARSPGDLGARSPGDLGLGRQATTRVTTTPSKYQPARACAPDPSEDQRTTAHPSLRSGRLLSVPSADRHRPEAPLPVVGTATIPVGARDAAGRERSARELQREREIHNHGCSRCQSGRGTCPEAAELIRLWIDAG